jgi:ABC-type dipeptide/oligopeptide/nickel transport system permease subunit
MDKFDVKKEQFDFVELDHKIFDNKFEGKPQSFLQDALSRFTKNKLNVMATVIVLMLIMLAVFVPILTPKDFTTANNPNTKFLPPRIPLIEKLGIFDGTIDVNDFTADLENYELIDESLGDVDGNRLYYPLYEQVNKFSTEFIKEGSLSNSVIYGGTKVPEYVGGTNEIVLTKYNSHIITSFIPDEAAEDADPTFVSTPANTEDSLDKGMLNASVTVDVNSISASGSLDVYIKPSNLETLLPEGMTVTDPESLDYYTLLGTITDSGETTFINTAPVVGRVVLVYNSTEFDRVSLNSVNIDYSSGTSIYFDGYELSRWAATSMDTFGGQWIRSDAEFLVTTFVYYKYNDIFADYQATYSNEDYDALLAANPGMEESIVYNNPADHSEGWTFGDGYPLKEVYYETTHDIGPDGEEYFSYRVLENGLVTAGYDTLPYFIFGTDGKGRDLFAEIWLSLRTSLILGVLVSVINIIVGVVWGSISGYFGGRVDFAMERFVEVLSSFPGLTVLTILYIKFGAGFGLLLIYLTYSGWIGVAGLTRIQFYRYRGREYVLASRTLGAGHMRLIFKHILPNGIGYIITSVVLSVPTMIITESALSYLGFGLGEGATLNFGLFEVSGLSLGILLYNGQLNMTAPGRFYLVMIPAVIIIIIMIAFNLFGNALRDAMNPSLRGQE